METTIGNYNNKREELVRQGAEKTVLESFRVMTANRMATNFLDWDRYFASLNSGTLENVLDLFI